jgi:ATP-dependent DNA helicase RecG
MDVTELRERISRWEDLHTEFKGKLQSPDELAKDIVCFANTDGGQIIVGVAEDRRIVGVDDPDAANRLIDNVAFNDCEPPIIDIRDFEVLFTIPRKKSLAP